MAARTVVGVCVENQGIAEQGGNTVFPLARQAETIYHYFLTPDTHNLLFLSGS